MDVKKDIRFRVYLSFLGMVVFAVAIIIKAAFIQTQEGAGLRARAEKAHTRNQTLPSERGNIFSEDGTLLSSTIPQFDLRVDFKTIDKDTFSKYVDSLSFCLAGLFGDQSAAQYKVQLKKAFRNGHRYYLLKKSVPYFQYQEVRNFPIFNKGKNRGGFIAESKPRRVNPYGMLAYRTIGLWRENASDIGLEQQYNTVLSGRDGNRIIRKTTGGVWMPIEGSEVEPENGKDVVTTLDIDIQDITEHALLEVLEKYDAAYGTAIVMEVETGKIRALANLGRQKDGSYWEDFNYAILPSEPGSTFKLMSLLALIDDGHVTIDDLVDVQGGVARFGNQRVVDDHRGMGTISIKKAFAQSSNVAFSKLVNQYYQDKPKAFIRHLQDLHLHQRTGIDLAGERQPLIKTTASKSWNKTTSLPWIAYGYESLITPLHTCMVYNAVANNGKLMKPYLVSAIKEYGKVVQEIRPTVLNKAIAKPETIHQLQAVLHEVVETGTGKGIKSEYYLAGGKTGTAQVADKGIRYSDGVRQGSFVGYFPWDRPRYTICVLVRSTPGGVYYGAVVGAPVFKAIADKLYALHIGGWAPPIETIGEEAAIELRSFSDNLSDMAPYLNWNVATPQNNVLASLIRSGRGAAKLVPAKLERHTIPDLRGMGLKDVLNLLEPMGLQVRAAGVGKVLSQSLPPGEKIKEGQFIHLSLG